MIETQKPSRGPMRSPKKLKYRLDKPLDSYGIQRRIIQAHKERR